MRCEFCCENVKAVESTSFYSNYCIDCLKLVKDETEEALQETRKTKTRRMRRTTSRRNSTATGREMRAVPAHSLEDAIKHLESGKSLYIPTYTRCTVITKKTLDKFRAVGAWLLKEDGEGYRLQTGKSSVYLLPGQLKYGN
jgi:hypothetical protein